LSEPSDARIFIEKEEERKGRKGIAGL